MAIAWLAFREPVGPRILVGAALIVVGAALVAWSGPAGFSAGAFLIVAACLAWAIDNNLTRRISAADPVQIAAIKGLAAGAVNLSIAFASGAALPGPSATAAALAVGLAGYGVSLVMFVLALRHVGAARAGAYFSTAPFIGATFGVLFLGESASGGLVAGGVLIAAVWSFTSSSIMSTSTSMECWTTITGILTTITTGTATRLQTRRASHTRIGIATSR